MIIKKNYYVIFSFFVTSSTKTKNEKWDEKLIIHIKVSETKAYLIHLSWSDLAFSAILNSVCKSLKTACRAGAIGLLAS